MTMRAIVRFAGLAIAMLAATPVVAQSARQQTDTMIAAARAAMLVDPGQASTKAALAEQRSRAIADPATRYMAQATAIWLQGEAASRLKDFATAERKLTASLAIASRHAPASKIEADILTSQGSLHGATGSVVTALREFQRAYAIYERLGDPRNRAIVLICIASLYSNAKDYDASLRYFDEALAAYDGDPGLTLAIQNNRAEALQSLHRYPEAERGFRAALAIAATMQSPVLRVQILLNIARSELGQNDLDGADRTIVRGQAIADQTDIFSRRMMFAVAAQAAFQRDRIRLAGPLIDRCFDGVDLATTPFDFRDAHFTAYRVFKALGQNDKAFAHLLALKRLDDQTTRLATSTGAALMAARFDFANQELKITRLKAEDLERRVATERQNAVNQRYIFYGGAIATFIVISALLAGLVVIRRSRNTVRAANDDLALANGALGKALAAKTEFLATTSHEIRTPLNGILGMTQVMLADPTLAGVTRDRLAVVHGAGTTMRALVDDILDVAKMETGKLTLETAPFDLAATILDATRLWEAQADAKGVAFDRALDACPHMVSGDSARVRQIVFNLLSNALKFTENGRIAIGAHEVADDGIAITIRDTGIGIAPDKLEAIFESFRQADAGTTRRFGGTGLGLAICRQLARAMGGDVSVESTLGEGSCFTATLPLPRVEAPASVLEDDAAVEGAILVLDRNPITRSLFRTLLTPHAGHVVFAADAAGAATAIAAGSVTRVLIDDATLRACGDPIDGLRTIVSAGGDAVAVTLLWPANDDAAHAALMETGITAIVARPVTGPSLVATLFRQSNDPLVRQAA